MNKQSDNGIEWTHVFGPGTGYTWRPIAGCLHDCRWTLPNGQTICYAKSMAAKFRSAKFMAQGFDAHYWHPERLQEPLKLATPAGIFLDSFSDLMGHWVPDEQIGQVLEVCQKTPQHIYFLLTKNPPRLKRFAFPPNVWVGISAPPSFMNGQALTSDQQRRWLETGLDALAAANASIKWLSAEPLPFDIAPIIRERGEWLDWVVIGAASRGQVHYQPSPTHVRDLLAVLDQHRTPTFFKGNLNWSPRRSEFPVPKTERPTRHISSARPVGLLPAETSQMRRERVARLAQGHTLPSGPVMELPEHPERLRNYTDPRLRLIPEPARTLVYVELWEADVLREWLHKWFKVEVVPERGTYSNRGVTYFVDRLGGSHVPCLKLAWQTNTGPVVSEPLHNEYMAKHALRQAQEAQQS